MMVSLTWSLTFILSLLTTAYLAYIYFTRYFDYWRKRGIPYIKPTPFLGNYYEIVTFKIHSSLGLKHIYEKMKEPFFGFYIFDQPVLMMKSPKLINDILVKDSSNFLDRTVANPSHVKLFSNFLFFQANPEWKIARDRLSPLFTPSKVKGTFNLVDKISTKMIKNITKDTTLDVKDLMDKFSAEFVGKCYFGITDNSLDKDQSTLLKTIKSLFEFTWRNSLVQMIYYVQPKLVNLLKLQFINSLAISYFDRLLFSSLSSKKSLKGKSNDFIDIFIERYFDNMEMGKEINTEEFDEILAHMITLTIGSETVGSTLSFALYELAIHEDIQKRLRKEIKDIVDNCGGINYEMLQETKFLDNCILETIRKYPIIPHICRKALNDYTFKDTDITIDKGTWIYIPSYALSNDEKYFPNPDEYNPDRFEELEKKPGEIFFLPFGAGPRICIGERFGIMVMKLALLHILLNFELKKCSVTPDKIELEPRSIALRSKEELLIEIRPMLY